MKKLYQIKFTTNEQRADGSRVVFSDFYDDYKQARTHFDNAVARTRYHQVEFIEA